jgi:hypothetical protein
MTTPVGSCCAAGRGYRACSLARLEQSGAVDLVPASVDLAQTVSAPRR